MSVVLNFKFAITVLCLYVSSNVVGSVVNNRPIIGILSEETNGTKYSVKYGSSSIVSSYVKFVESAGARVVPIMIYQTKEYYKDLMSKINGILFPGGGVPLNSSGYGQAGRIIFDLAVEMNQKNDYFPIWGTCLGFELLNYLVSNKLWMKACQAEDKTSQIKFVPDFRNSRMFHDIGQRLQKVMETENVTVNYHQWCLTPENYSISGLNKFFKILSIDQDLHNITYISSIEAYHYPFYGVTFHPEKVLFEWVSSKTHHNIPHSSNAIKVSQYFANFFVSEARKNLHRFSSKEEEDNVLIYNFQPVFMGKHNLSMEQSYFFNYTSRHTNNKFKIAV